VRKLRQERVLVGVAACVTLSLAACALRARQTEQAPSVAPKSHYRVALPRRQYLCAGGASIVVLIEPSAVRLTFNGIIHNLKQVGPASPSKFSDGTLLWAVDGDTGVLEEVSEKDNPKNLAEGCALETSYPLVAPAVATVTGTIAYPEDLVLPPEAEVIVDLKDLTLEGASSRVIAVYKARLGHSKSPVPFKVTANPSEIDPHHRYGLEARIVVGGDDRAIHAGYYNVLTHGDPTKVDIVLVATGLPKIWKN